MIMILFMRDQVSEICFLSEVLRLGQQAQATADLQMNPVYIITDNHCASRYCTKLQQPTYADVKSVKALKY